MLPVSFIQLVQDYSVALLDAPTPDQRTAIADEIADDAALAVAVLMLLSEQILPLLPDVQDEVQH